MNDNKPTPEPRPPWVDYALEHLGDNPSVGNETPESIIERGMRDLRNDTLAAAVEICETVAGYGGSATDCAASIKRLRDSLNGVPAEEGKSQ